MFRRFKSLRAKLILGLLPALLIALLLSFMFSAQRANEQFQVRLAEKKESLKHYPAVLVEPVWNFNTQTIEGVARAMMSDPDILHVQIRDEGNNLVHEESSALFDTATDVFIVEEPLIYHNAHITQRAGTLKVVVGNSSLLAEQQHFIRDMLQALALTVVTLLLAVSALYSKLLDKPIRSLSSAINSSRGRMVFAKAEHSSSDELGEIATAFNKMQHTIEKHHTELANSERHLRTLYHSTPSLLFSFDRSGTIQDASDYFLDYLGFSRKTITGAKLSILQPHLDDNGQTEQLVQQLWSDGNIANYPLEIRNAANVAMEVRIDATLSASDTYLGALAVITDITSLNQAHRELDRQANVDMLSGLPNRNQFQSYLEQLVSSRSETQNPFALMFIDLDRFKTVNDTFGHHVGDELIRAAGKRIAKQLRTSDKVARLGGDEFAIVLEEIECTTEAETIAQRILATLEESFHLSDCSIYASASIGIACYPADADTPASLLQNADIAMYRAKEDGRSRYAMYSPEHNAEARQRARIEELLRTAIEESRLELHYQPIVNMKKGFISGAEVLLRLRDGEEIISPFHFIPVAEETGLIVPIGAWCMEQACAQLAHWRNVISPDFYLSVNVSTRQFQSEQLFETVASAIKRHEIPADRLLIEITESLLLHDNQNNQRVIAQLDELGCQIAIDDFGTGYSALSYLMRFPLDILKIDRSFISQCGDEANSRHRALVEAIILMSQGMKLKVITEGIETREQMEFVLAQGGQYAQGYLFAKPMTAAALETQWHQLSEEVHKKCVPQTHSLLTETLD